MIYTIGTAPTCRNCGAEATIYPLRNNDGKRAAWCASCIIKNRDSITEQPTDFNPEQGELFE